MRILVVEDEPAIADFVRRGLQAEGYAVDCAHDGVQGERMALSGDVDLVILDMMLPERSGTAVLERIRSRDPALPVIILTARGEVPDKVAALDSGANDYVTNPFSFDELAARVRAHLRSPEQGRATELSVGDIKLNFLTRRVERDGMLVTLSAREFELLAYFMRHPGQVLSKQQILSAVWGYNFDPGTNVVEVYVGYQRRKLAVHGGPAPIETLRSVGYRLVDRD